MRQKINFNENWYFHKGDVEYKMPDYKPYIYMSSKTERMLMGPACKHYAFTMDDWTVKTEYNDEVWTKVNLPHDFVIEQEPSLDSNGSYGFLNKDNAWYVKSFNLTDEDKINRITLFFEGVASECDVYLNGCIVKHNFSGYNSFEVDVTDFAKFNAENRIAVYVRAKDVHEGWWYEGAGIYRNVWLVKTYPVAVDLWGVYVRPEKTQKGWLVNVETTVRNDFYQDKDITLVSKIIDASGNEVAQNSIFTTAKNATLSTFNVSIKVDNPSLWSPETPNLYTLRTKVIIDGIERDEYDTRFGFRTYRIDSDKGLFINDKHYFINGVCGHADCGLTGKAVPDAIFRHKVRLLKEMGANGYRTSHYMQAQSLMDALDENGFIVMDETRWFSTDEESIKQLTALVKRDRNRPSVFFWSVGNEEPHHTTEEGKRIYKKLANVVKGLDSSRLITTAVSHDPDKATVYDDCDIIGINYNWNLYDKVHKEFSDKGVFCSEGCATGTTRGWYFADDEKHGYISAYDHDVNNSFIGRERVNKFFMERPWIFGSFQWISFDHRGESVWPRLCSQSGAMDMFMNKKDAFYQNVSHWTTTPMVHLLPHWNFQGLENTEIKVVAYTNAPKCELLLNGNSLGVVNVERGGHAEWFVPYQVGEIKAVAYDEKMQPVATDKHQTTGSAQKLCWKVEMQDVDNNGDGLVLLTCYAVDEQGRQVPNAIPFVRFSAEGGTIVGTGSDVSDHIPPCVSDRQMFAGVISVLAKANKGATSLKVYAAADNLQTAIIELTI